MRAVVSRGGSLSSEALLIVAPASLPSRPRDAWPGLVAAVAFGSGAPVAKWVFADVGWWAASAWIALASGLAFLVATRLGLAAPPRAVATHAQRIRGRVALIASTLMGPMLGSYCALKGLSLLSAHEASALLNLETVFTPLLAVMVFGERLAPARWAGAACVVAGGVACALIVRGDGGASSVAGVPWIAASSLCWAVDSNLLRYLVHRDVYQVARDKGLLAGVAAGLVAFAVGHVPPFPDATTLLLGAVVGIVGFGVALVGYLESVRRVGTATSGALFGTGPFVGVLVAWLVFGERPGLAFVGVTVVMALGVYLLVRPLRRSPTSVSHPGKAT